MIKGWRDGGEIKGKRRKMDDWWMKERMGRNRRHKEGRI